MFRRPALRKLPAAIFVLFFMPFLLPRGQAAPQKGPADGNTAVSSPEPTAVQTPVLARQEVRYKICKGDVFDLKFDSVPEFNQTVAVQPDGYVTLMELGDVEVEGQTVPELTERLQRLYGRIIQSPQITVVLKQFTTPTFTALGELMRPGQYEIKSDVSVVEAIALAGGFNGSAKHSQVLLMRSVSDEWVEVKQIDVKKILQKPTMTGDVRVRPGDIVYVPASAMSKLKGFIPRAGLSFLIRPRIF